jgi:hypothetical protein
VEKKNGRRESMSVAFIGGAKLGAGKGNGEGRGI